MNFLAGMVAVWAERRMYAPSVLVSADCEPCVEVGWDVRRDREAKELDDTMKPRVLVHPRPKPTGGQAAARHAASLVR